MSRFREGDVVKVMIRGATFTIYRNGVAVVRSA